VQAKTTGRAFAGPRKASQGPSFARRLDDLARQREQRIAQIAALRQIAPSRFLDHACRLLAGRFWSRARVRSREQLLQTVDWLIGLAEGANAPSGAVGARRPITSTPTGPVGLERLARPKATAARALR
jgi:hypothetical protein